MQRQTIQDSIQLMISPIYHSPDHIDCVLSKAFKDEKRVRTTKKVEYYNVPAAFDIETTSFIDENGNKRGIMYEWTLGLNGYCIVGRTWEDFNMVMNRIIQALELDISHRLIIYVHNLGFELQWIQHYFHFESVLANSPRKPIFALTSSGIEFRCSYLLSGYSLKMLAENLNTFKVRKLDTLDYSLIRHSGTYMSDDEILYCLYDVLIVMAFICEEIERNGSIINIPLTKTGYVRRYCRDACLKEDGVPQSKSRKFWQYHKMIKQLRIQSLDELKQMKRAFQGGFTHENPFYARYTLTNVSSDDETSAYPAMAVEWDGFPMSSGKLIAIKNMEDFEKNIRLYACIFDIQFINLRPTVEYENYISISRCWDVVNPVENNGRLVSCDRCSTTITEIDFKIIRYFYTWDSIQIRDFRRYRRGRLPKNLIKAILDLYVNKTSLKGIKCDTEEEQRIMDEKYMNSKSMLNAVYGCMVQDPIKDEIDFADGLWKLIVPDYDKKLAEYNDSWNRFLFYPWGIYICAFNRACILNCIREFADDYVYSDTDSIKTLHREEHLEFLNKYNEQNRQRMLKAMDEQGLPREMVEPKTIKGEVKTLGALDYEGTATRWCGLGAKRYMAEKDGHITITVSGLNKYVAGPYLVDKYGDDVFEHFDDELEIPAEHTGKLTHTYIDDDTSGYITDYQGNTVHWSELSSIHLGAAPYELSLAKKYRDYLMKLYINHKRSKP